MNIREKMKDALKRFKNYKINYILLQTSFKKNKIMKQQRLNLIKWSIHFNLNHKSIHNHLDIPRFNLQNWCLLDNNKIICLKVFHKKNRFYHKDIIKLLDINKEILLSILQVLKIQIWLLLDSHQLNNNTQADIIKVKAKVLTHMETVKSNNKNIVEDKTRNKMKDWIIKKYLDNEINSILFMIFII